jgi:hypothetical protein
MGRKLALLIPGLYVLAVGCETLPIGSGLEITRYASRNLTEAPISVRDDCMERARNRQLGEQAWAKYCQEHPEPHSVHYAHGFVDGVADYLYAGGTGEPPVVPPWCYRRAAYETPEGVRMVEDWFAGFRLGAHTAAASGLRSLVVVPVALPAPVGTPPPPANFPSAPAAPVEQVLPPPRKATPVGPEAPEVPAKP